MMNKYKTEIRKKKVMIRIKGFSGNNQPFRRDIGCMVGWVGCLPDWCVCVGGMLVIMQKYKSHATL